MNSISQSIIEEASKLSAAERIEVIDALLASVDKPDAEIDALWAQEAESRLAAYQQGELKAIDLNPVISEVSLIAS